VFTGIIAAVGAVRAANPVGAGVRLVVDAGGLDLDDIAVGNSIAVNGACLTVVARIDRGFEADVSRETLECTAGFAAGSRVNLEKALRPADRLGGHLVAGHVDGVGSVVRMEPAGNDRLLAVAAPRELAKYIARKGSIAVNGVSLTVNAVNGAEFTVNLIPHTLSATNLGELRVGDRVNLEADPLARYLERLHNTGER
jgi:riboflavin synthase